VECKDKMKKSSDSRGEIHRNKILEYMKSNSLKDWLGVQVNEIVEHTKLSRPTVTTHLNRLVTGGEIKKTRRGTYLPAEIFDDLVYDGSSYLEDYLNVHLPLIIQDNSVLNLQEQAKIIMHLSDYDYDKAEEPLEKFLFKFANRIGACIVYVLIESLRPRRNVRTEDVRSVLTDEFMRNAIPLMDLLEVFLFKLPINERERGYFETTESTLETISDAYRKVYPKMSKSLDKGYLEFCDIILSSKGQITNNNCSHKWEKIFVHKIGDRYLCRKCDTIVASPQDISGSTSA
jgi:hypothetical protein